MNSKLALFSVLLTFAPMVVGCSAADARSDETSETGATQGALAVGIQTVTMYASSLGLGAAQGQDHASPVATFTYANGNVKFNTFTGTLESATINTAEGASTLGKDLVDLGVLLKLGAYTPPDGALGSTYEGFTNGYVRVLNETSEITEVGFGTEGNWSVVPARVALAAAHSRLGTLVSITGSGASTVARFTVGSVRYDQNTAAVGDVTLTGIAGPTQSAAKALGLGAYVRGTHERGVDHDTYAKGTFDFDTLQGKLLRVNLTATSIPASAIDLAVNLGLGAYIDTDGGMESVTDNFQNGAINHGKFGDDSIGSVTVTTSGGQSVPLPLPVAKAAAANAFGTVQTVQGAAGSIYYTFADGVVRWSSVNQSLAEVTLK